MKGVKYYWILAGILLLGAGLRFWNLETKPLWMDEVITALFGYGRSYLDVPYEQALPLSAVEQLFTLNSKATCAQITATVAAQSVHPPLFFCWLHQWLAIAQGGSASWVWILRAFPALVGVGAIAAAYQLNRVLFSAKAGLVSAAMMAVSPFAVYLSQEARHYSLPMLLVMLALLGLYHLVQDLQRQRLRPSVWVGWIVVNSVGFYVHYFFFLAFFAQAIILGMEVQGQKAKDRSQEARTRKQEPEDRSQKTGARRQSLKGAQIGIYLAIAAVCLSYLPWLPTLLNHVSRPETDWMNTHLSNGFSAIAPLYQLAMGWMVMVIALPVEQQSLWIVIPLAAVMVFFTAWLARRAIAAVQRLYQTPETHLATRMLVLFTGFVVLEFLAIAYLGGKDLTRVPRYNFIYFPAVCALLGAVFSASARPAAIPANQRRYATQAMSTIQAITRDVQETSSFKPQQLKLKTTKTASSRPILLPALPSIWLVLLVGLLSSGCVVTDLVFQKSYNPRQVAQNMAIEPDKPALIISAYDDFQDVALGLSFALSLHDIKKNQSSAPSYFAFIEQRQGYERVWQTLAKLPQPLAFPLNLWVIAPGLKRVGYPKQLALTAQSSGFHQCAIDPTQHHRIGIAYQLYRCF
jgi:uncharacterized membrane protein